MPNKPSARSRPQEQPPQPRPRLQIKQWKRAAAVAALLFLWLFGTWVRGQAFQSLGYRADGHFFLESAQHYRNVKLVAEGSGIPRVDVDLEYPGGLHTRSHTILGETLLGGIYRLFNIDGLVRFNRSRAVFGVFLSDLTGDFLPRGEERLTEYVRLSVRYSMALLAIPIYLIAAHLAQSRLSGFLAAILYAVAYAAVERSMGWEFYHEHTAFPFLAFHLYFHILALEKGRWRDAALSALLLLLALLCWKIIQFYLLTLVGFHVLTFLAGYWRDLDRRIVAVHVIVLVMAAFLFENHLRYGRFWFSKPMLVCYALLIAAWLLHRYNKTGLAWRLGTFGVLAIAFMALTGLAGRVLPETSLLNPAAERYGHVWETLFAIIRYAGNKPPDPSLLSFDARHYWGAPNTPPSWIRALSLYGLILPMAAASIVLMIRRLFHDTSTAQTAGEADTAAWRGPLDSRGAWLILYLFAAFLGFYALFYKMTAFLAIFTAILSALGYCTIKQKWGRMAFLGVYALLIVLSLNQSLAPGRFFLTHSLRQVGLQTSAEKLYQNVLAPGSLDQLMGWLETETTHEDAILTEFVLAPTVLVYGDRPVNLNPFFESTMRLKYREFSETLFKSEEEFHAMCSSWKTRYFIYNAHILLRTDPWMSCRYVANRLDWSEDWAAFKFHYRPAELKHFALVYQNTCFRVYRVLEPGEEKRDLGGRTPRLFDEKELRANVPSREGQMGDTGSYFRRALFGTDRAAVSISRQ